MASQEELNNQKKINEELKLEQSLVSEMIKELGVKNKELKDRIRDFEIKLDDAKVWESELHKLNGEILIPYNQAFVDKLVKNTTNILDGGMVKIEGIFYEDELNDISEFIQVSNISDDKH